MKLSEVHLIQLSAVVNAGSVSKGAAALGVSQPALSRSLAQLE
ncbi:MAG: LysR family transcriptional regulator, partial [Rhodobacteraceae bacterium]|nr:LysR family transcriptional regulator [Paracoccaceae bacterium]